MKLALQEGDDLMTLMGRVLGETRSLKNRLS